MRVRVAIVAGVFALGGLALAGCDANIGLDGTAKQSSRGFTAPDGALTLLVDNDVAVVPGKAGRLTVQRWLTGKATQRAEWTLHGDTLTLTAPCHGMSVNCGARYRVAVPPDLALRVSTHYGDVSVRGMTNGVDVDGTNGDIDLSGDSGAIRIASAYGDVSGERLGSTDVLARSQNGDVRLSFATTPKRVGVTSTYGDVDLAVPKGSYHVATRTRYGDVRSAVSDDPASDRSLAVSSDNGDVVVRTAG